MTPASSLRQALESAAVLVRRAGRESIRFRGPDCVTFLNNLTTNDVKSLEPGAGCETFFTSLQGKTIGFGTLHRQADGLLYRTDAGGVEALIPTLEKYGVFDDVAWERPRSIECEWHLLGPACARILQDMGIELSLDRECAHITCELDGASIIAIVDSSLGSPGVCFLGVESNITYLNKLIARFDSGSTLVIGDESEAIGEGLRILAGTPRFGFEVTPDRLPQELGRDTRAISFKKGCYLGQETVARIDALGHVNRMLKGVVFDASSAIAPGAVCDEAGKQVAVVTSIAPHPSDETKRVALGFVRVKDATDGRVLTFQQPGGESVAGLVARLPINEPRSI